MAHTRDADADANHISFFRVLVMFAFPQGLRLTARQREWMHGVHSAYKCRSKKLENHEAAIALHYMHYNYCRIHQTLRVTPAMEAGLADHVWSIEELVGLLG